MRCVLIANRGEIALRVIRACRAVGLGTVAVYSAADANAPHVWSADRAVRIGPPEADKSYLRIDALLHVARAMSCDAIHPGYGFLAENATFAARCAEEGIIFIGPSPDTIALMGDKAAARRTARKHDVPIVPGTVDAFTRADVAAEAAAEIGFPLLLKARAGGGGRGMRIVERLEDFPARFVQAQGEAAAAFGDGGLYLERYFTAVRHIEIQVFGDRQGHVRHLWERDCSVQRRHQKLVEEAPSPALDDQTRTAMCSAAESLAKGIGYVGAGTVEFLYDPESGAFYFIEMNTRIQVEHPVTEMLTGLDLVAEQLCVARGEPLSFLDKPVAPVGHAIEFRINAEDAERGFTPSPGRITRWRPPSGPGVRLDSHVYEGYVVPPFYDSLLGKLIVHAGDRRAAIDRAAAALADLKIGGVATTVPFHRKLLSNPEFLRAQIHTRWVEETLC